MSDQFIFDEIAVTENGQSHRTVRIAEAAVLPNQLREIVAFMGTYNVRISRMSDDKRAKSFQMSADEMDTLAAQWIQFREDCISAREAEEKRVEEVKAQAFKLIEEEAPYIKVSEELNSYYNTPYWQVNVEEISYSAEANTADQLLEAVNSAINLYIEHTLNINEAKTIVKAHPEIKVTVSKEGHKYWKVSIPNREGPWADPSYLYNAAGLLSTVKQALAWLEQQQAECAQSVAQTESGSKEGATNSLATPDTDSQQNSTVAANQ